MDAAQHLIVVEEVGLDLDDAVNIEVDFDYDEAREILSFMSRYHFPTYADAVRAMAMLGAGTVAVDPTGSQLRLAAKIMFAVVFLATGAFIDHDTGW